jgi:hypothetical protein
MRVRCWGEAMLVHRLSPFVALGAGRSFPEGLLWHARKALLVVLVSHAALRRGRITGAGGRRTGTRKTRFRSGRAAGSGRGDRAGFPSGPHGASLTCGTPLSATLSVCPSKIFSNTPGMIF